MCKYYGPTYVTIKLKKIERHTCLRLFLFTSGVEFLQEIFILVTTEFMMSNSMPAGCSYFFADLLRTRTVCATAFGAFHRMRRK